MYTSENSFRRLLWNIIILLFLLASYILSAQSRTDSLKSVIKCQTNDSLKIIQKLQLSRELHKKEHNEKEEYEYAQDAIQEALKLNDTFLYAKALDNLGLLYRYHQHYDEAMPLHIKAFKLIRNKNTDPLYKMIFANNAGVAARYNEKYDSAISHYVKALKIAEEENDLKNIAISSNGIGNALGNIHGRAEEALEYFKRSLEAEKKRNNSLGIAMNYLSIGDYYIDKQQFDKARRYLNELLEINQQRNDLYGLAITYEYLGIAYLEEKENLEKAASYFKNSLQRFRKLNDNHKQAELLVSLGDIELIQNKPLIAEDYYQNSLILAKDLNQQGLIRENSLKLAGIMERDNKPAEALRYFKQGKAYEDSIELSEQNVEIAALIRKYDLEKKENHIQLLEKDRALQQTLLTNQEQKLNRRRIFLLLMGTGLLFILTIVLLQYRNSRTKRKTNARVLKEEKEKMKAIYERNLARAEILVTRLRINPHFLFNSLNAITYLIQSKQNSKAIKYLVVFSRYTRMVLETSQKHVVSLIEEIKLTQYYLTLEENRFEKDFTFKVTGNDSPLIEKIFIPPLLLQPFIENAIWHGLLPSKRKEKTLLIDIISHTNKIQIIIDDNGVGRRNSTAENSAKKHKSMGIKIIEERIELFNSSYSGKISYKIIDKKNENGQSEGTRIILDLLQKN
ncbi:tetratricopeptide repeat protein [Autumnicola musiva]|uniref:Tetratricopeptide repeat protein n=1 Tax=Autumnicola musiva TaxID=3075589 RepID=A0ABU3D842_9FLAO|nr:tetratricopeptide repeat protein [Zunongwangia sp. F117]MDT0677178.1 tetratricopeptide repeat protein [Zunongwangia sp. F117]